MKLYIGGIGTESNWRDQFKELTSTAQIEISEGSPKDKTKCDYLLYVVTPNMKGVSAIMDAVNDSNLSTTETVFCTIDEEDGNEFTSHQVKSLVATGKMVELNGGKYFKNLKDMTVYITGNR